MIFSLLNNLREWLKAWILRYANSEHATRALFGVSFAESSFFPIPPDFMLIAILVTRARRWWYYALVTLTGSLLGGLAGYLIGFLFFSSIGKFIIDFYDLNDVMQSLAFKYEANAFWTVFVAAFTPIPYKIITISAGFFNISIFSFITASLVGRGGRFFIIAFIMKVFGKKVASSIYRYFNIFSIIFVSIVIVVLFILKFWF
ncbi:MAG: VTT domain-containing protein [Parcubacteria group bacterium]|nr:VTT domain-containing protein [Parcubacteria group bacterium]MCR4342690.1 VTT domain-containing protein [Patescibacteria group bacterium]